MGIGAAIRRAGQPTLPVRRQQAQRIPAFPAPGVRHLAALKHDMIDRVLGEDTTACKPGVPGTDDDRCDLFDGEPVADPEPAR